MQLLREFGSPANAFWRAESLLDLRQASSLQIIDDQARRNSYRFTVVSASAVHAPESPEKGQIITLRDNFRDATPQYTFWLPYQPIPDCLFPPGYQPARLDKEALRRLEWSGAVLLLREHAQNRHDEFPYVLIHTADRELWDKQRL